MILPECTIRCAPKRAWSTSIVDSEADHERVNGPTTFATDPCRSVGELGPRPAALSALGCRDTANVAATPAMIVALPDAWEVLVAEPSALVRSRPCRQPDALAAFEIALTAAKFADESLSRVRIPAEFATYRTYSANRACLPHRPQHAPPPSTAPTAPTNSGDRTVYSIDRGGDRPDHVADGANRTTTAHQPHWVAHLLHGPPAGFDYAREAITVTARFAAYHLPYRTFS